MAAIVLLVAGIGPGLAILAWLLCPLVMLVMMRTMGHTHTAGDARSARSDLPAAPPPAASTAANEEVRP